MQTYGLEKNLNLYNSSKVKLKSIFELLINELHFLFTLDSPWIVIRGEACDLNHSGPNSGRRKAGGLQRALVRPLNTLCRSHFSGNAKCSAVEKLQGF